MIFAKQFHKALTSVLAALTCFSCLYSTPVQAEEVEYAAVYPRVILKLDMDEGLELLEDDIFEISFVEQTSKSEKTVDINASLISDSDVTIDVEPGVYSVNSIEYMGENTLVDSYAISNSFTVTDNQDGELQLIIGSHSTSSLPKEEYLVIEAGDEYTELGSEDEGPQEEPVSENTDDKEDKEDLEDDKETEENDDQEESSHSSLWKGVPLLIAAVIMFIVIFIMNKKGKFDN